MDRRALQNEWHKLVEAIAPDGLTEQEERALLEAKIIVSHVASAHEQHAEGEGAMVQWSFNGETMPVDQIPAKGWKPGDPAPMANPKWEPKSTVLTYGRPVETREEWEEIKKAEKLVETSKRELRRSAASEGAKLSAREKENLLALAIEKGKEAVHAIANGQEPPPLDVESRFKPGKPPVDEDMTDAPALVPAQLNAEQKAALAVGENIVEAGGGSNASVVPGTGERIPSNDEFEGALYNSIQWR